MDIYQLKWIKNVKNQNKKDDISNLSKLDNVSMDSTISILSFPVTSVVFFHRSIIAIAIIDL